MAAQPGDLLAMHAQVRGDKVALIHEGRSLTFGELHRRANRVANALRGLGLQPGDRFAGMAYNGIPGNELSHASRRAGAVGVPISFRLKAAEVAYVINDCEARVITAGEEFVPVVDEARRDVLGERIYIATGGTPPPGWLSYEDLLAAASEDDIPGDVNPVGATMIYTSGTTGKPKGAYRPNGVNIQNILQVVSIFGLNENDVHLVAGPGYHSAVGFFSYLHQILGATVVLETRFDAEEALRLIAEHRVTTTFMAPTLIARMLNTPDELRASLDVGSMRAIIAGAAPFPISLKERCEAYFGQVLWEFYGATETGINTILRPEDQLRKPGSCGTAVPGQEIKLLDEEGVEVPVGAPGEFYVKHDWLAEYYKREDATQKSLKDGFFSVGDIAYVDEEGFYYICDRKIDMIISGGVNIYPAEIEAVLISHPAVEDSTVIGVPNDEFGEEVKAVVKLRHGRSATEAEIIEFCGSRLAGYKRPKSVDFVNELPRSTDGKLLKRQVRDKYWAGSGRTI